MLATNTVEIIYNFPGWFKNYISIDMISFYDAKNILELDSGGSCTTL